MVTWEAERKLSNPAEWRFSPKFRLVIFGVIVNILTTSQLGYMSAIWNHPRPILERFFNGSHYEHYGVHLNEFQVAACYSISVSAALISCLPFGMISAWLLDKFGRKTTCVYICATISAVSNVVVLVSKYINSYELFFVGRFIYGLAEAIQYSGVTLYITECSPAEHRGLTGAMMAPSMGLGLIFGTSLSHPALLGTDDRWQWLTGAMLVPNIILLVIGYWLPDSPKFAFITQGNEKQARGVIRQFSGADLVDQDEVLDTYRKEGALAEDAKMQTILSSSHLRKGVVISTVAVIAETCEGWIITDYYSATLFRDVGVDEHYVIYAILGCQSLTLIGCLIVMSVVDCLGRRPLVNIGLIISVICIIVMMVLDLYQEYAYPEANIPWVSYACVGWFALMSFANTAATTIVPILRSELVPQNVRSVNSAISTVVNSIIALILCISFPIIQEAAGSFSLLMFIIPCALGTIYLWIKLPETKGKTVEQIVRGLRKLSVSKDEFVSIMKTVRKISVASVTGDRIHHDPRERDRMLQELSRSSENRPQFE